MRVILTLVLLIMPSALFGADATPIYVWGFGDKIAEVFKAVSMAIDESGAALTAMAFTIGLTITGFRIAGLQGRPLDPIELAKFPLLVIVLQQVFLSNNLSPDYAVIDETTDQMRSVGELPAGIGQTFSLFSRLQRSILDVLDSAYSTPDSISYRKAGLGFGLSAHDTISTATPVNPSVMMSFDYYVNDCLSAESVNDPNLLIKLQYSSDPASALAVQSSFITSYVSREGVASVEYCADAWNKIISDVGGEANDFLKQFASANGYSPSSQLSAFEDKVSVVAQTYFGMSADANSYISKAMLGNMFTQSTRTMSALTGINAGALAFMPAYAERKAVSGMYTTGMLATKYMPVMQMILTALIISVSWILALLAIATVNMRYISTLFTLVCVVFMWIIIGSIMNFIFDLWAQEAIEVVSYNVGSGYTIGLKDAIDETIGNKLALLGYMSWLTPILAYGLVKGSDMALAGMFSAIGQMFNVPAHAATGASTDRAPPGQHALFSNLGITYVDPKYGSLNEFAGGNTSVSRFNVGGEDVTGTIKTFNGIETVSAQGASGEVIATDGTINQARLSGAALHNLNSTTASTAQQVTESLSQTEAQSRQLSKASEKAYTEALNESFRRDETGQFTNSDEKAAQMRQDFAKHIVNETANVDAFAQKYGVSKEFASQLRAEAEAHIKGDVTTKWDSSNQILGKIGALATGASVEGVVTAGGSASITGGLSWTGKGIDGQESTHNMSAKDAERFMNNLTTSFSEAHKFNASNADLFSKGVGGTSGNSFRELQSAQQSYAQSVNQLTSAVNTHSLVSNVQQSVSGDRLNQYLQVVGTRPDGTLSEGRAYEALVGLNRLANEGRFNEIQTIVNNAIGGASQFGESSALYNSTAAGIGAPSSDGLTAPVNNLGLSDAQQQTLQNHLGNKATLEGAFETQKSGLQVSNGVQQVKDQTAFTSERVEAADGIRTENTEEIENSGVTARGVGAEFLGVDRPDLSAMPSVPGAPTMPKP